MQVISLFSGIGGFELAAEWAGWDNVVSCEINPFGRKVLEYYWPNAYHHDNVTTLNYDTIRKNSRWNPLAATIVVGGFPCQPFSLAGKRKGTEDSRHLWPEMLRVIREVQPEWVVGENVFGIVNWDGGLVFDQVQTELEAEGYEVQPYVLPACSVNAPHRRDRVWFVAHSKNNGRSGECEHGKGFSNEERSIHECKENRRDEIRTIAERFSEKQTSTHSISLRLQRWEISGGIQSGSGEAQGEGCKSSISIKTNGSQRSSTHPSSNGLHDQPTEEDKRNREDNIESGTRRFSPIEGLGDERSITDTDSDGLNWCNCEHEINSGQGWVDALGNSQQICERDAADTNSGRLSGEEHRQTKPGRVAKESIPTDWTNFPTVGPVHFRNDGLPDRLVGITFPKWRNEGIKACGNAIVPQVVFQIFKTINLYEQSNSNRKRW